jgi:rhodanese-related sulfurtransferase
LEEVLLANQVYAQNFDEKGALPLPPARHFAILTCMDARLAPAKYAGLSEEFLKLAADAKTRVKEVSVIVCYCGGGNRSALVADSLQNIGYTNVFSLEGGFRAWKEAELPTDDK